MGKNDQAIFNTSETLCKKRTTPCLLDSKAGMSLLRQILKYHGKHSQLVVVQEAKQLHPVKEQQPVQLTILSGNLNLREREGVM